MSVYHEKLTELLHAKTPFVSVIVVDTTGSVPNESGTKMLVTQNGLHYGTVGGGKVEKKAIEEAIALLNDKEGKTTQFVNWSLSRDVGMTCGGQMKLFFEKYNVNPWRITVFGAGHVANALIDLLAKLECRILCIDPRPEWLNKLSDSPKLETICSEDMPSQVANIPDNSFVLLMTMGHSTDKPILIEILKTQRKFPYLGVIGSEAKAVRLRKDVVEAGLPESLTKSFYCPIGLELGSNHPEEIAISIIAQLIQQRDLIRSPKKP
jgi:xanthine dehydrogenase accessory factor